MLFETREVDAEPVLTPFGCLFLVALIPFMAAIYIIIVPLVRRQRIWHQSGRFLRDTFLPVASPV